MIYSPTPPSLHRSREEKPSKLNTEDPSMHVYENMHIWEYLLDQCKSRHTLSQEHLAEEPLLSADINTTKVQNPRVVIVND